MPQSGAAASRFGKSPDDIVRSTCGENLHGFHKDCFWGCKIELSVYGVYGKPAFCTLLYAGFAYQPLDLAADFTLCREMLHGAHKQKRFLRTESKTAVQSVQRVRQF